MSRDRRERERSGRTGFTLVEMLVVIVILGLLATIAVTQIGSARENVWRTTLQHDLKQLALHQELYYQQNQAYTSLSNLTDLSQSEGVTVSVNWIGVDGFAATATHTSLAGTECGYHVGSAPSGAAGPATQEGLLTCNQ